MKAFCGFCSKPVQLVEVHGHVECPDCHNVVESCCTGTNI